MPFLCFITKLPQDVIRHVFLLGVFYLFICGKICGKYKLAIIGGFALQCKLHKNHKGNQGKLVFCVLMLQLQHSVLIKQ